jgi:hypothetical protein
MIFAPLPGLSLIGIVRATQWVALFCASAVDTYSLLFLYYSEDRLHFEIKSRRLIALSVPAPKLLLRQLLINLIDLPAQAVQGVMFPDVGLGVGSQALG